MMETDSEGSGRSWRWVVVAPVLGVVLLLLGLAALGKTARDYLRNQDRYTISFEDIDCTPPPGQQRADFLDEVQYLGSLPGRLQLLDDNLAERLAEAFARHPRVERVERVAIVPPRQVQVRLVYKTVPKKK